MIAKRDWFERRKYTGWGLGKPRKWQGWVYLATVFIPFVIFQSLPYWDTTTRVVGTAIWIAFLLADLLPLMVTLKKDEREHKIEAIAERNALYAKTQELIADMKEAESTFNHYRAKAKEFAYLVDDLCPGGKEREISMAKLEESVMWANAAIARS